MNGHANMIAALIVGPTLGLFAAWLLRLALRHWRKKPPAIPQACTTVAVNDDIEAVRSATARMKSKAGI